MFRLNQGRVFLATICLGADEYCRYAFPPRFYRSFWIVLALPVNTNEAAAALGAPSREDRAWAFTCAVSLETASANFRVR